MVLRKPYLGVAAVVVEEAGDGGAGGGWRRRRWWRRRRPAPVATDRVESDGDLESFGMKSEMTRGGLLFIGSKISPVVLI
jgi:hypothetical protein